jgi:streptogrisin C
MKNVCGRMARALQLSLGCLAGTALANPTSDLRDAMERDLRMSARQVDDYSRVERLALHRTAKFRARFAKDYAGSWFERDEAGGFVWHVGVKAKFRHAKGPKKRDPLGADVVERSFSLEELERASEQLASALASMSHNDLIYSWGISELKNALVVVAAEDHAEAARSLVQSVLPDPDLVEISFAKERPTASMRGGERVTREDGGACSVGFNALRGNQRGFVSAGHCFVAGTLLTSTQAAGGATVDVSSFTDARTTDGMDGAWARIDSGAWTDPAEVNVFASQASPIVVGQVQSLEGAAICRFGTTSGARCGTVGTGNVTVTYRNGSTLRGLRVGNFCGAQGDSGGAVVSVGGEAQGVFSGMHGDVFTGTWPGIRDNCHWGDFAQSYYQPVQPILSRWGLTLRSVRTCGRMNPGDVRLTNEVLRSCNGTYGLTMQADGNLVLRRGNTVLWQSGGRGAGSRLELQLNGTLLTRDSTGRVTWSMNTRYAGATLFVSDYSDLYFLLGPGYNLNVYCDFYTPGSSCHLPPGSGA